MPSKLREATGPNKVRVRTVAALLQQGLCVYSSQGLEPLLRCQVFPHQFGPVPYTKRSRWNLQHITWCILHAPPPPCECKVSHQSIDVQLQQLLELLHLRLGSPAKRDRGLQAVLCQATAWVRSARSPLTSRNTKYRYASPTWCHHQLVSF